MNEYCITCALTARLNAPFLNGNMCPSLFRVPSGYIQICTYNTIMEYQSFLQHLSLNMLYSIWTHPKIKNPTRGWKITLEFITRYWLLHYFAGCKFTTYESYLLTIEISQADMITFVSWITKKSKLFKSIKICVGLLVFDYSESSH